MSEHLFQSCGIWPKSCCIRDSVHDGKWEKFGRANLANQIKKISWDSGLEILFDLAIRIIKDKTLKINYFSALIKEVNESLKPANLSDDLCDIFSFIENELPDDQECRIRFKELIEECIKEKFVTKELLHERLSVESLISFGFAPESLNTRIVKLKTRLFYKQQKFNLLREENEGFSKLLTELTQFALFIEKLPLDKEELFHNSVKQCHERILVLIGYFDLDPNRILALILDVLSCRLSNAQSNCLASLRFGVLALMNEFGALKSNVSQIVGHKFQLIQKDANASEEHYLLTAVLIQMDLLDLYDIYPYLEPLEDEIEKEYANSLSNNNTTNSLPPQKSSNIPSALNNGSSSTSRDLPSVVIAPFQSTTENSSDKLLSWLSNCQSLGVARYLLALGDWKHAEMILNRWPGHFATYDNEMALVLCNFIYNCICTFYNEICPLPSCLQSTKPTLFLTESTLARYYRLRHLQSNPIQIQSMNDMRTIIFPICSFLGPNLHNDPILLATLCRLGKAHFDQRANENGGGGVVVGSSNVNGSSIPAAAPAAVIDNNFQAFFNLLDECILPALTLCSGNGSLAEEVWEFVKSFPYEHRYRLYGQWHDNISVGLPKLIAASKFAANETKYILKRLSKENVRKYGRQLGKLSHSCPSVVFVNTIQNIQLYTNLANPIGDAFKYLNGLSGDVLAYFIVATLASDKRKLENNQLNPAFQALANFTALLAKKYHIDLSGVLHYVFNQMCSGVSCDLLLLREIMHKMTGIEVSVQSTPDQLEAMCGGELLRHEAGTFQQIRNTRRNSQRLRDTLITENLALPLVFALAQRRESILYEKTDVESILSAKDTYEQSMRLKIDGLLFDECQDTLLQFITFLGLQMSVEEFQRYCSSLTELVRTYHQPLDVAFGLLRNVFHYQTIEVFEQLMAAHTNLDDHKKMELFIEASNKVYDSVISQVKDLYEPKLWKFMTPRFVTVFWTLQTSDIEVPSGAYRRQILSCQDQLKKLPNQSDMTDIRRRREEDRLNTLITKLQYEESECKQRVAYVVARLKRDCIHWFVDDSCNSNLIDLYSVTKSSSEAITEFVYRLIPARVFASQLDAEFCAKFALLSLNLKIPGFSLIMFLDKLFEDICLPLMMCTENEAARFGHFLSILLQHLSEWHSNKQKYISICVDNPCFDFHKDSLSADAQYECFRHIHHKWHYRLTKTFVTCTESENYIQIRNSLLVLTHLLPHFPRVLQYGHALEKRIETLSDPNKNKRKDLQALAKSHHAKVRGMVLKMIPEHEFHDVKQKKEEDHTNSEVSVSHSRNISLQNGGGSSSTNVSRGGGTTTSTTKSSIESISMKSNAKSSANASENVQSKKEDSIRSSTGRSSATGTTTNSISNTTSSSNANPSSGSGGSQLRISSSATATSDSKKRRTEMTSSSNSTTYDVQRSMNDNINKSSTTSGNINNTTSTSSSSRNKERNSPGVSSSSIMKSSSSGGKKRSVPMSEGGGDGGTMGDDLQSGGGGSTSRKVFRAQSRDSGSEGSDGRRIPHKQSIMSSSNQDFISSSSSRIDKQRSHDTDKYAHRSRPGRQAVDTQTARTSSRR